MTANQPARYPAVATIRPRFMFSALALRYGLADRLVELYWDVARQPEPSPTDPFKLDILARDLLELVDRYADWAWQCGVTTDTQAGRHLWTLLNRLTWMQERIQQHRAWHGLHDSASLWTDIVAELGDLARRYLQDTPTDAAETDQQHAPCAVLHRLLRRIRRRAGGQR